MHNAQLAAGKSVSAAAAAAVCACVCVCFFYIFFPRQVGYTHKLFAINELL